MRETRRPNLATIVGSGLAAVAAGSLLAFSSLAEQAGLQGLATGGIQPAAPARGATSRAIRLPAPTTTPPGDPAGPLEEIVRDAITRATAPVAPPVAPGEPAEEKRGRPGRRGENGAPGRGLRDRRGPLVAFAPREVSGDETEAPDDPSHGNAHGHDKRDKHDEKAKKPRGAKHGHGPKKKSHDDSGKAGHTGGRTDDRDHPAKPPKPNKGDKDRGSGHAKGHAKHADKAKGHDKHAHDKGKGGAKGKGHSKHGH